MANLVKQISIKQLDGTYKTEDIGVDHTNVDGLGDYVYNVEKDSSDSNKIKVIKGDGSTSSIDFTMTGASSTTKGTVGLVPEPAIGDNDKFLRGDGTWVAVKKEIIGVTSDDQIYTFTDPLIAIASSKMFVMVDDSYDNKFITKNISGTTYTMEMEKIAPGRILMLVIF